MTEKLIAAAAGVLMAVLGAGGGGHRAPIDEASAKVEPSSQGRWEAAHRPALASLTTPVGRHNVMGRVGAVGRTARGRQIRVHQLGDPSLPAVLVLGCIHGTECAARTIEPTQGCPVPDANINLVRNLNRDGYTLGTRLNGRGVDLNRNFPEGWKRIGTRGSPQYSGPRPFSEPETRVAAHLIRWLQPKMTVWFHQSSGPAMVRAWGHSIPLARRYARLARLPFRRLPWLAGTAPNWQNNRFPDGDSFVVELPAGDPRPMMIGRNAHAILVIARRIAARG